MLLLLLTGVQVGNQAPTVNAGSDVFGTTNIAFTLAGSVTDDGLPSGTLTSLWTKVSGPGIVTFVDATNPGTNCTIDTPGSYVLQLTGDDTALQTSDTISVTISDPTSGAQTEDWVYWH
jgi:hypothetical protein